MRNFALAVVVFGLSSCATVGERFQATGLKRAAFELECPVERLSITYFNANASDAMLGFSVPSVGVAGCDRKLIYRAGGSAGWEREGEVTRNVASCK